MAQEAIAFYESGLLPNQRLGRVFLMPKSAKGSRAHMQQVYTEIRAIDKDCGWWRSMVTWEAHLAYHGERMAGQVFAHIHMLLGVDIEATPESIDQYVSAEILICLNVIRTIVQWLQLI
uniref:Uncharacterized protein n=1 Tax=Ditylenchus dipsaci TaxID=166011 RepID=A0A915DTE0_9BILA